MSARETVMRRLDETQRRPDELSPHDFETSSGSQGRESVVAELQADAAVAIRDGTIKVAIPAYQSFETDGTGGPQTFGLNHSIADSPDTHDAVVWFGSDYQGVPDVDHETDEITVDGPSEVVTVHAFYISTKPATVTFRKSGPKGDHRNDLKELSAGLVHQTNQSEQPESMRFGRSLRRFIATDMSFEVLVDAPYVTRFEDPDGDGATATNALLEIPVLRAENSIEGLTALVVDEM